MDKYIARPIASLLNILAWILGCVMNRDHDSSSGRVKTIVISKYVGIGSIVRATPFFRTLSKKYPEAKLVFVTSQKNYDLVERLACFDETIYLRDNSFFKLIHDFSMLLIKLWKSKVDLYFDLEVYSAVSSIVATLSLARNRYGFYKDSTTFRLGLYTHLVFFNDKRFISSIYMQMLRACDIVDNDLSPVKPKILPEDKQELDDLFSGYGLAPKKYIVVNPNASNLLLERRWPVEYFSALIEVLVAKGDYDVFLVGSEDQHSYTQNVMEQLSSEARTHVFNTAGLISLGALIALMHDSSLVLTNDSGIYHLAVTTSAKVVSLWGPGNPEHYADRASVNNVLLCAKELYCRPCIYRTDLTPCKGNNVCMKAIKPTDVFEKISELLCLTDDYDLSILDNIFEKLYCDDVDITTRKPGVSHG